MDLAQYLKSDPWPAGDENPLDCFWTFRLPYTPEQLWPFLADTSEINRKTLLPKMKFHEENGLVFGTASYRGWRAEWQEVPWNWVYPREISAERIYSRGFARKMRARYLLEKTDSGTDFHVYFGWIPSGTPGRIALFLRMKELKWEYGRFLRQIRPDKLPEKISSNKKVNRKAARRLLSLEKSPDIAKMEETVWRSFRHFLLSTDPVQLHRIRIPEVAHQLNLDRSKLLVTCLHATRAGILLLSWDLICPHCRGEKASLKHLGEIPRSISCEICGIDFESSEADILEVTFRPHPGIVSTERILFCAAEPSRQSHILVQQNLAPGASVFVQPGMTSGRYRLRVQGKRNYDFIHISPENPVTGLQWTPQGINGENAAENPTLQLTNSSDQSVTFIVEQTVADRDCLRPADLFQLPEFHDLFNEEAIAGGVSLDVGEQTILFTDIVGSSALYEQIGDQNAFFRVRMHFVTVYGIVNQNRGIIIKTIGDSAMAAFASPSDAANAAVNLQEVFAAHPEVRLRISLHCGPCLAVNLNSRIDYFGAAVNLAAKILPRAEAGEVIMTDALLQDRGVRRILAGRRAIRKSIRFPWSARVVETLSLP